MSAVLNNLNSVSYEIIDRDRYEALISEGKMKKWEILHHCIIGYFTDTGNVDKNYITVSSDVSIETLYSQDDRNVKHLETELKKFERKSTDEIYVNCLHDALYVMFILEKRYKEHHFSAWIERNLWIKVTDTSSVDETVIEDLEKTGVLI